MRLIKVLLLLSLCSCASTRLLSYEQGDLIKSNQEQKIKTLPPEIRASFQTSKRNNKNYLEIRLEKVQESVREWTDVYSKVGVYETKCRGWRGRKPFFADYPNKQKRVCEISKYHFFVAHILMLGFLYDLTIPFSSYDEEVLITKNNEDGFFKKHEFSESSEKLPVNISQMILRVNNSEAQLHLKDDKAEVEFSKIGLSSVSLEHIDNAEINIDSLRINIAENLRSHLSGEYHKMVNLNEHQAREKQRPENQYQMKFCESYDLYDFILYGGKVETGCMYVVHAPIKVLQSVPDGFLAVDRNPNNPSGIVFIKTKRKYVDNDPVEDMLVVYDGPMQYQTIMNAQRTVHGFRYLGDVRLIKEHGLRGYSLNPDQGY